MASTVEPGDEPSSGTIGDCIPAELALETNGCCCCGEPALPPAPIGERGGAVIIVLA